jgi:GNAT superfamily N-acetyltransferase
MGKVLQMVAREEIVAPGAVSGPAKGIVEITLSMNLLDQADNLRGAASLWMQWANEEGRLGASVDRFVDECVGWIRDGRGMLLVAYVDGVPAGMVTLHIGYDASKGRVRATGERLYVAPEYRNKTVFKALWAGAEMFSDLVGAQEEVISCRHGSYLQDVYERAGFRPTDVILKREV